MTHQDVQNLLFAYQSYFLGLKKYLDVLNDSQKYHVEVNQFVFPKVSHCN